MGLSSAIDLWSPYAMLLGRRYANAFTNHSPYSSPDSRFPIPDSRFPIPDSRFPVPCSLPIPSTKLLLWE
ncbi:MAG: hypothetical protein F6K26_50180 [Moorea sp. SIO2I5]|nr:hypothetical protein [Moorena sp. SIO2I5]